MSDDELKAEFEKIFDSITLEDSLRMIARHVRNQEMYGGAFVKLYYPGDPPPPPEIGSSGYPK